MKSSRGVHRQRGPCCEWGSAASVRAPMGTGEWTERLGGAAVWQKPTIGQATRGKGWFGKEGLR